MDFSSLNPHTSNALNLAARNNDVKAVERLLKKINPNCIDNRGWTCLHEAAAKDSYQSLLLILKHRATRPLAETHEGHTALYLACRYGSSIQTIQALLESDPDIANYGSTEEVTPLHIVSAQGRVEVIQMLIDYGAMINVQDFDGDTPLLDAAISTKPEAVSALLHAGADPEIKNESNYTPFHLACYKGCFQTVSNLMPFVTDINQVTVNGDSPLILATQGCSDEVVKFLLKNGADPHIKNMYGDLALSMALHMGHSVIFKMLLAVTDINKIDQNIVLYACKPHYFKFEILDSLLMHPLGPEFFDFFEPFHVVLEEIGDFRPTYLTNAPLNSFLHICEYIYNESPETFRKIFYLFLMRGLAVDALDVNECPPIVYINYCMHSNCFQEVVDVLMEHDCNVDYCTNPQAIKKRCIPDAFIASLTSDPTTSAVLIPYSLKCDPEFFLQFAFDYGVIGRIPQHTQDHLLKLIGVNSEEVKVETLSFTVLPLQHLCRQKIRCILRQKCNITTTKEFLKCLNEFKIPHILKSYLRYV